MNDVPQTLDIWGDRFEGEIGLRPGNNRIRVVALGAQGPLAEKSVEVQYVPPAPSPTLRILRPADGAACDPSGQNPIEAEGEVSAPGLRGVRVVFNEFTVPVAVRDGRFAAFIPAIASEIAIRAESDGGHGVLGSDTVTVRCGPVGRSRAYVLLHLPTATGTAADARVLVLRRENPADPESQKKVAAHTPAGAAGGDRTTALFAFPSSQGGAYAIGLDYRIPPGESVKKGWAVVFVPSPDGYRNLRLGPFELTGKGRVTLARFLLPHGIYWEDDSWFTGKAESAESVTKFRYSDGMSWTEKRGEPDYSVKR